jgi:hypothetical protein
MMIQLFLTAVLTGIGCFIGLQRSTSRLVRVAILAVVAAGGFFVWVPEETTAIAERVGVGRGADLMLYLWVVITLALILILYLKVIRMTRKITQLTRAIALMHVEEPARPGSNR